MTKSCRRSESRFCQVRFSSKRKTHGIALTGMITPNGTVRIKSGCRPTRKIIRVWFCKFEVWVWCMAYMAQGVYESDLERWWWFLSARDWWTVSAVWTILRRSYRAYVSWAWREETWGVLHSVDRGIENVDLDVSGFASVYVNQWEGGGGISSEIEENVCKEQNVSCFPWWLIPAAR